MKTKLATVKLQLHKNFRITKLKKRSKPFKRSKIWCIQRKRRREPQLKEPAGRRVCPNKLAKTLAKKRQMDSTKVQTKAPVAKKKKLLEKPEESEDTESARVELDERTTQILEEELQAIMIKVWQALPDNPPSPAEKYVAEQLRNEASDDIRNVLGLNVTKRLLNVFNPLNIRFIFSAVPTARHLRQLEKEHNLHEMESLRGRRKYGARARTIADFDRLCHGKELRCGDMKVAVFKRYVFYDCPTKLKTRFMKKIKSVKSKKGEDSAENVENEVTDKKTHEATSSSKVVQQATTNSEKKNESDNNNMNKVKSAESYQNKVEQSAKNIEINNSEKKNNLTPNKVTDPKLNVVKETHNVGKATTQSNAPKPKPNQITQEATIIKNVNVEKPSPITSATKPKPNQITQEATIVKNVNVEKPSPITSATKPKPNQITQEATIVKNVNVEKPSPITSATKPKPNQMSQEVVATKNVTEETPKLTEKTTTATKPKPNQVNKVVITKEVPDSTPKLVEKTTAATKKDVATKKLEPAPKSAVKSDENPSVIKTKPNQVNKEVVAPKKVADSKPKLTIKNVEMINSETFDQEMNDDEEMNDEEILALISSGVVVDECSGSDEE